MSILSIVFCWIIFGLLCGNILIDMTEDTSEQTGIHLDKRKQTSILLCGALLGPCWLVLLLLAMFTTKREDKR